MILITDKLDAELRIKLRNKLSKQLFDVINDKQYCRLWSQIYEQLENQINEQLLIRINEQELISNNLI